MFMGIMRMFEIDKKMVYTRSLCVGLLSVAATVFSAAASAKVYQLPGLRPSDPTEYGPVFLNDVDIVYKQKKNGSYVLRAIQKHENFSLVLLGDTYTVEYGSYKLKARFDANGNLLGGFAKVHGGVNELTDGVGLLAKMKLNDYAFGEEGEKIGFNTTDLVCPQFDFCTTKESIYLAEFGGGFDPTTTSKWTASGLAVTTIPVPAAAWLFGSALIGLAGVGKRRSQILS